MEADIQTILQEYIYSNRLYRYNWSGLDNIYQINDYNKIKDDKLKEILSRENEIGILRQELVSMIPVSLIEIKEDSIVLDLCAAPGNKSIQIIEKMQEDGREKGILPRGVLISNELDLKRSDKLVNFLNIQPNINIICTQCPAEDFPSIKNEKFQPDVIICDVPCSGDGTTRKNKGIRKKWRPDFGFKNHEIQIKILENAIRLCKNNGYVVYSTCAINPLENEAVIAHVIEKFKNIIEICDVSKTMKEMKIKYTEGLVKWKIPYDWSKNQDNIEWAYQYSHVTKNKHLIKESMFHDIYTLKNFQNNIYFSDPLNLRRCIRIYSHQNNSGSFFIAVIKKIGNVDNEKFNMLNQDVMPLSKFKYKSIEEDLEEFMKFLGVEEKKNA